MREDTKPEHRCPACGHRSRWPVIRCRACGWQATNAQRGGAVLDLLALVILILGALMFGLWCMATDPMGPAPGCATREVRAQGTQTFQRCKNRATWEHGGA